MPSLPTNFPRDMCAYCGSRDNLDSDHVPPKNLFLKPRPMNIITVPACPECHSGTSMDDEYFRVKLCLRSDASEHPKAKASWDSIFRSLNRKEAKGLRSSFFSDIRHIQLRTQTGLYIGSALAYDVDMNRIRRVVERTVRGLYFAESCKPLGLSNEVRINTYEEIPSDKLDEIKQTILMSHTAVNSKVIGDNVFSYCFHIANENPVYSIWGMSFYAKVLFLCITGPPRPKTSEDL